MIFFFCLFVDRNSHTEFFLFSFSVATFDGLGDTTIHYVHKLLTFPDRALRRAAARFLFALLESSVAVQERFANAFEVVEAKDVVVFSVPLSYVEVFGRQTGVSKPDITSAGLYMKSFLSCLVVSHLRGHRVPRLCQTPRG